MLILKKFPGGLYPQITQAPITTYADFLNFFRGGHTIDDNVDAPAIASSELANRRIQPLCHVSAVGADKRCA
jgi:hypothetical protein